MRFIIFISFMMLLLQGCISTLPVKQPKVVTVPADKVVAFAQPAKGPETDCRQSRGMIEEQVKPLSAAVSDEERLINESIRIKRQYIQQVFNCWHVPPGTSGLKAEARVILNNNGDVLSVITTNSGHSGFDDSVRAAVQCAAPFKLPEDAVLRKRARNLSISFTSR